jgi:hypothetical protein
MPMTKEDWRKFEEKLGHAYGGAELMCDGYQVYFSVQKDKGLQYVIMTYVDGWFKGKWTLEDCEIRRKFMRPVTRYMHKPKERQKLKALNKKLPKKYHKDWMDPDKTVTFWLPLWPNAQELRRHLVKNCDSIEWGRGTEKIMVKREAALAEEPGRVVQ